LRVTQYFFFVDVHEYLIADRLQTVRNVGEELDRSAVRRDYSAGDAETKTIRRVYRAQELAPIAREGPTEDHLDATATSINGQFILPRA
jgi:hypothetical protein